MLRPLFYILALAFISWCAGPTNSYANPLIQRILPFHCAKALTDAGVNWRLGFVKGRPVFRALPVTGAGTHPINQRAWELKNYEHFRAPGVEQGPDVVFEPFQTFDGGYDMSSGRISLEAPLSGDLDPLVASNLDHEMVHAALTADFLKRPGVPHFINTFFSGDVIKTFGSNSQISESLQRFMSFFTAQELLAYKKQISHSELDPEFREHGSEILAELTTAIKGATSEVLSLIVNVRAGSLAHRLKGQGLYRYSLRRNNDQDSGYVEVNFRLHSPIALLVKPKHQFLGISVSQMLNTSKISYAVFVPLIVGTTEVNLDQVLDLAISQLEALSSALAPASLQITTEDIINRP